MHSRESDRRLRQQENTTFHRSLRSEGRERTTESKGERRHGRNTSEEIHEKGKERSIPYPGDLPPASRATPRKSVNSLFHVQLIKQLMDEVLDKELSTKSYESETCKSLCLSLSEDIKQKVKDLGMSRYRIICHVSIGSCNGQGLLIASRFIWNHGKDNFVTATYRNLSLFAVATVFGVLKE